MNLVHDLQSTVLAGVLAVLFLSDALREYADGAPVEDLLLPFSGGTVFAVLLADGVQRRWRGDPRTRTADPDRRTTAATGVAFGAFALVGAWSLASGHSALTWALLLGGGLLGLASSVRDYRRLDPDSPSD